nr:hypothetical protein [Trichocoleus desertorum]
MLNPLPPEEIDLLSTTLKRDATQKELTLLDEKSLMQLEEAIAQLAS